MDQEDAPAAGQLVFHGQFNTKRAGDVIIRAGDEAALCFYFRFSLLRELSPFFASLPPPAPSDCVNGTPLIDLPDVPSRGLDVFLSAIQSTLSSEPFNDDDDPVDAELLLAAANIGRKFDCPIIYRLLVESLDIGDFPLRDPTDPYTVFAIWSIGGVKSQLERAALRTVHPQAEHIMYVDDYIPSAVKAHSEDWTRLLKFHLSYTRAPVLLHQRLEDRAQNFQAPFTQHAAPQTQPCVEVSTDIPLSWHVYRQLRDASTVREILAFRDAKYGLRCGTCHLEARQRYSDLYAWLEGEACTFKVEA